jgi:hypothetical protein
MRVGNGQHEDRHGCGFPGLGCWWESLVECNRPRVEELTGRRCDEESTRCLGDDGSGWFFVMDEEAPPCAAHAYWLQGQGVHPDWAETEDVWGREANFDWLVERVRLDE